MLEFSLSLIQMCCQPYLTYGSPYLNGTEYGVKTCQNVNLIKVDYIIISMTENGYSDTIGPVTLYVYHGDITTVPATAFVNVTSDNLWLESGNISRRVLAAAGTCIQHEG